METKRETKKMAAERKVKEFWDKQYGRVPAEPSPEVAPMQRDPKCHLCGGAGAVDSGGNEPWGAQIWIKCGYCGGTGFENPLGPEDLAELDRLMETHPRLWLHIRTVGQVLGLVQEELAGMKDARPYTVKGPESPKCPHCGLNEFMHFGFESPCPTPVPAVAPRETQTEADKIADIIFKDSHQWSTRRCATCRVIGEILGKPFGCYRYQAEGTARLGGR